VSSLVIIFRIHAIALLRTSPAYGKTEYDSIGIKDCVRFDMEGTGISAQETQVYAELAATGGAASPMS
jgi:hypothetical protein